MKLFGTVYIHLYLELYKVWGYQRMGEIFKLKQSYVHRSATVGS